MLATGPMSIHRAMLFRQLSDDIVYVTNGSEPTVEKLTELAARGIVVVDGVLTTSKPSTTG